MVVRERYFQWPSEHQIKQAEADGCFLVPTGFSGSLTEDTEWRISFSMLERDLIWSWKYTQVKCYVFLKLVLKRLIQPVVPEVLNTYQLKTLMFWQIEGNSPEMWSSEKLECVIMHLLQMLLNWVEAAYCPHYFIKDNNLFKVKVYGENQQRLADILQKLVNAGLMYIIQQFPQMHQLFKHAQRDTLDQILSEQNALLWAKYLTEGSNYISMIYTSSLGGLVSGEKLEDAIKNQQNFVRHYNQLLRRVQ